MPAWVDPDYGYDPENPRKPYMREIMKALALQNEPGKVSIDDATWKSYHSDAFEILYATVGSSEDTRNWTEIMASDNINRAAGLETAKIFQPRIDIEPQFDENGEVEDKYRYKR